MAAQSRRVTCSPNIWNKIAENKEIVTIMPTNISQSKLYISDTEPDDNTTDYITINFDKPAFFNFKDTSTSVWFKSGSSQNVVIELVLE